MPKTPTKKEEADQQLVSPALREIELSKLDSNPWQPRSTQPTDEELAELMNSIKAVGQKMPILVRPDPKREERFQIGDGAMRRLVSGKLGLKTIMAMVQPLTDRQMKILALAANTFVRLRDSDKETAVYRLWESEFKTDEEGRPGVRKNAVFTGLREMERESGMALFSIQNYLNAYETRNKMMREASKEQKVAVRSVSAKDLAQIAEIAKESPLVAREIVMARTDPKAPLKSSEVREVVDAVKMAATPAEKERVTQEIIQSKREVQKEIEKIKDQAQEALTTRVKAEYNPEARAERRVDDRERLDREQKAKEDEIKKSVNADTQLRMRYFDIETQVTDKTSDTYHRRIVNIRDENTKYQTIASIRSAAKKLTEFAARFKE